MVQTPAGLYVVAAVIVEERQEEARAQARAVLPPKQVRFHWRDEGGARRLAMLGCIVGLGASARGYVHRMADVRRQDRSRALCFKRLLWDLGQAGVGELVIESRREPNDRKDRQTIIWAQKAHIASQALDYRHGLPKEEPLLWFADALAGALRSDEVEGTSYLEEEGIRWTGRRSGPRRAQTRVPVIRRGARASLPRA